MIRPLRRRQEPRQAWGYHAARKSTGFGGFRKSASAGYVRFRRSVPTIRHSRLRPHRPQLLQPIDRHLKAQVKHVRDIAHQSFTAAALQRTAEVLEAANLQARPESLRHHAPWHQQAGHAAVRLILPRLVNAAPAQPDVFAAAHHSRRGPVQLLEQRRPAVGRPGSNGKVGDLAAAVRNTSQMVDDSLPHAHEDERIHRGTYDRGDQGLLEIESG